MKFAFPFWLFGTGVAALVAIALIFSGVLLVRARKRFGEDEAVKKLVTENATNRRAIKGALLTLAVALGFVALAQPQYGRGTRTLPATNLDVVLILDYSKSMYARDVAPSRSERAKAEVSRLIRSLPGARFAAVAFAGEPIAFPLTSDGGAIAQFFRQLVPNDMPVGGTAIARALEWGLDLLRRDPESAKHRRVMILITDGEDLTGDPIAVAKTAAEEGITVHVVQIGGRTPEPIPEVAADGSLSGMRRDEEGKLITTALTAEGETQLAEVAKAGGGSVVRGEAGMTGIETITQSMKRMMTEELSETVETVYADVYAYPAGLALLLLFVEAFIASARRRKATEPVEREERQTLGSRVRAERAQKLTRVLVVFLALLAFGCEHYEEKIFIRNSPDVDRALANLGSKDAGAASSLLETYLETGECKDGVIGTGGRVRKLPQAGFDLGLALFQLAERYGEPFDAPAKPAVPQANPANPANPASADPNAEAELAKRSQEVECALMVVQAVAADRGVPSTLRAEAYYLAGNLEFLRGDYESAVKMYDDALRLSPGVEVAAQKGGAGASATLPLGNWAAWNRAIALRRIEENKPPPNDAGAPPDENQDQEKKDDEKQDQDKKDEEKKEDEQKDKQDEQKKDEGQGKDDQEKKDEEQKKEEQAKNEQQKQDEQQQKQEQEKQASEASAQEPPPSAARSQDDRVLDMLESAPTLQQEAARRSLGTQKVSGREDR